jgi:SsrA-binding protein
MAKSAPSSKTHLPTIENRKARHLYHILDTYEVGVVLRGTEVKSIRQGNFNLSEAFCTVRDGALLLVNAYIDEYDKGNIFNHLPKRERRLLAHKREIAEISSALDRKGLTVVPLKAYFKDSFLKVEIATAKGKEDYDKRADKLKRESDREIARALRARNRT